jgi:hypothetical protein
MSIRVVCIHCRHVIYECRAVGRDYNGDPVKAEDMIPATPDIKAPVDGQEMLCPLCGQPFFHEQGPGQVVLELEGGAFWPHPVTRGQRDGDSETGGGVEEAQR